MKFLYLSQANLGSRRANSVQVMRMCAAFAEQGCNVTLIANVPSGAAVSDVQRRYGVLGGLFRIKSLPVFKFPGSGVIYATMAAGMVLKLNPDIVYGRFPAACYLASFLGRPLFYEIHSAPDESKGVHGWFGRKLLSSNRLNGLICISATLQERVEDLYPNLKGKTLVVHDGAEIQPGSITFEQISARRLNVGYVGSMNPGKGADFAINLASHFPDMNFLIAGGEESEIEKYRATAGKNVHFLGFIEPGQVPEIMSRLDIALAPYGASSRSPGGKEIGRWMSPLKLFEYMASGIPMIVSDLPVLREILQDDETALMPAPGRVEEWIYSVNRLAENLELRKRLATNARHLLEKRYSWSGRAREIIEYIEARKSRSLSEKRGIY